MEKVVVFDLDGTLLDEHNRIIGGEKTMQALHELKENGFHLAICTGRLDHDIVKIDEKYHLDIKERISQNGAVIYKEGHVQATLLEKPQAISIARFISQKPVRLEMNTISNRYWSSERDPDFPKELYDSSVIRKDYQDIIPYQPIVLFLVIGEHSILEDIQKEVLEKYEGVSAILSSQTSLEIVHEGVSKGQALKDMYDGYDIYAIGDSQSDQSMSAYAKYFYYASQEPCVKAIQIDTIDQALEDILKKEHIR